jgi:hypothetical protein
MIQEEPNIMLVASKGESTQCKYTHHDDASDSVNTLITILYVSHTHHYEYIHTSYPYDEYLQKLTIEPADFEIDEVTPNS